MESKGLKVHKKRPTAIRPERTDYKLTKGLAGAIVKRIEEGKPLFTAEQWKNKKPSVFNVDGEEVEVMPGTYSSWVKRNNCPLDTRVTLKTLVAEAKHRRFLKKHEEDKQFLVAEAQKHLKHLQALPLGTSTTKKASKKGYNEKDGAYNETSEEEISTPVNPAMVAQKRQGAQFVLERLDPSYSAKSENKGVTVHVSLKELREAAEAKKKADYEQ